MDCFRYIWHCSRTSCGKQREGWGILSPVRWTRMPNREPNFSSSSEGSYFKVSLLPIPSFQISSLSYCKVRCSRSVLCTWMPACKYSSLFVDNLTFLSFLLKIYLYTWKFSSVFKNLWKFITTVRGKIFTSFR